VLPVGANKGSNTFVSTYTAPTGGVSGGGWIYDSSTGNVSANCAGTEKDDNARAYTGY
jgi:hypothetical protein